MRVFERVVKDVEVVVCREKAERPAPFRMARSERKHSERGASKMVSGREYSEEAEGLGFVFRTVGDGLMPQAR